MTMLFYFKPSPSSMIPSGVPLDMDPIQIRKVNLVKKKKKLKDEDELILSLISLLEDEEDE